MKRLMNLDFYSLLNIDYIRYEIIDMRLYVYEDFDKSVALADIKETLLELKRKVEGELSDYDIDVRVSKSGSNGYSIFTRILHPYI